MHGSGNPNSGKAVIIKDEPLLVLRRSVVQGSFSYSLAAVEELLFINEFIGKRDSSIPELERDVHQIEYTFACRMVSMYEARSGDRSDAH
ncbi:hypothetical protein [Paenibacillus sacheonensis]|uniref:Uncharacterized protein n=1 Tax=Paenibacillus sacheonensis TaxID=742054 RepID=A0A7X5BY49_9BACL|nr:hypothetical protein [Paenibacillus sacheonensis]MBM7564747.1 hypothetical protein [Paenibacillus sacheonensis]NBC69302.1 hypothetical protein [Paenibacillus sacheonensis]